MGASAHAAWLRHQFCALYTYRWVEVSTNNKHATNPTMNTIPLVAPSAHTCHPKVAEHDAEEVPPDWLAIRQLSLEGAHSTVMRYEPSSPQSAAPGGSTQHTPTRTKQPSGTRATRHAPQPHGRTTLAEVAWLMWLLLSSLVALPGLFLHVSLVDRSHTTTASMQYQ